MSSRIRTSQSGPEHSAADSEALVAYLLNALEPDQQRTVHRHLQDCDVCYLEYTSLAVLPGLLDTLSLEDISDLTAVGSPQPAPVRPERAERPERSERPGWLRSRRRRASLLAGGAFSAAMVATGFAPAYADSAPVPAHPGESARPSADAQAAPVELAVSAESLPGDLTALDVEVRSAKTLRECVLEVTTDDGAVVEACRWSGAPSTRVVFSGDIPLAVERIRAVAVLAGDGTVLARRDLSERWS